MSGTEPSGATSAPATLDSLPAVKTVDPGAGAPGLDLMRRFGQSLWDGGLACWLVYLVIAVHATWPLSWSLSTTVSLGFENEAAVPLLNVWTMWWNSDRLAVGLNDYWNAPIFFPTPGTFAFSEAQPTMMIMAPIVWLSGSRVLAYNCYLLLILSLNGWSSQRLFLRLGHCRWLAFAGGVLCQMLPFLWWQSGVIQLTTLFGINWTIHSLLDVFEIGAGSLNPADGISCDANRNHDTGASGLASCQPMDGAGMGQCSPRSGWMTAGIRGVKLAVAYCLTYFLCNYWGLFLTLLLIPSTLWFWNRNSFRFPFWISVGVAALLSAIVLGPYVSVQRSLAKSHQWSRDLGWIRELSAHPRDYLDTPRTTFHRISLDGESGKPTDAVAQELVQTTWTGLQQLEFPENGRSDLWCLGGGFIKLLVCPLGFAVALLSRQRRRWGLFVITLIAMAYGLSLGPTLWFLPWVPGLAGMSPYELLQQHVPGFSLIRSPFRFAMFVQLGIVWLNVEALDFFNPVRWSGRPDAPPENADERSAPCVHPALRHPPPSILPAVKKWTLQGLMILSSILLAIEVWPPRQSICVCPPASQRPSWVFWLRENSLPEDAVVCLPFPTGYAVGDYQPTTVWMYWGTFHRRRLVNGYSGFFPKHSVDLKEQLTHFQHAQDDQTASPQLKLYPYDSSGIKGLNDCGARYAIVKRTFASRDDVWQHPITKFRWAWVAADEAHGLDIYEIQEE